MMRVSVPTVHCGRIHHRGRLLGLVDVDQVFIRAPPVAGGHLHQLLLDGAQVVTFDFLEFVLLLLHAHLHDFFFLLAQFGFLLVFEFLPEGFVFLVDFFIVEFVFFQLFGGCVVSGFDSVEFVILVVDFCFQFGDT